MKKASTWACILLANVALFGAQANAQMKFGLGPLVGMNFGTTSFSPAASYPTGVTQGGRTGFILGAQAELGVTSVFYIVLQPNYIGKGYRLVGPAGSADVTIDEIQLPLLFKVRFLEGLFRPYAFVGPTFAFVLSATESYSIPGQTFPDEDLTSWTSKTDFAMDFGGGAELNVTPMLNITIDARYSVGLASLMNSVPNTEGMPVTSKASGFQILVGAMFHVK